MHLQNFQPKLLYQNSPHLSCNVLAVTADSTLPTGTNFDSSCTKVWQKVVSPSTTVELDTKSCCVFMTTERICRLHCHKESCADPLEQLPRQLHRQLLLSSSQHSTQSQTHHKTPSLPPLSWQQQPRLTLSSLQHSQAMVCNILIQAGFRAYVLPSSIAA